VERGGNTTVTSGCNRKRSVTDSGQLRYPKRHIINPTCRRVVGDRFGPKRWAQKPLLGPYGCGVCTIQYKGVEWSRRVSWFGGIRDIQPPLDVGQLSGRLYNPSGLTICNYFIVAVCNPTSHSAAYYDALCRASVVNIHMHAPTMKICIPSLVTVR